MAVSPASLIHLSRVPNRWIQLMAGIVAMMAIANLQYAWTSLTQAHSSRSARLAGHCPSALCRLRMRRRVTARWNRIRIGLHIVSLGGKRHG
jgi:hypothetical protein